MEMLHPLVSVASYTDQGWVRSMDGDIFLIISL